MRSLRMDNRNMSCNDHKQPMNKRGLSLVKSELPSIKCHLSWVKYGLPVGDPSLPTDDRRSSVGPS